MNRRKLLGVVGAMGAGAGLGASRARADDHAKMADDPMMRPLGNHHLHFCGIHCAKKDARIQIVTTPVPIGEPMLMWSLTADGQDAPNVIASRDRELGVSTAKIRKKRLEAIGLRVPTVPQPKDMDAVGRQWTASGEDRPTANR